MQVTLTTRHFKKNKIIQDFFDERVDKLSHHLSNFREDTIFIHGNLEKNPHKEEYYISLSVHIPSATLHSRGSGFDLFKAINEAFDLVTRQAEKLKAKLRRGYRGAKNKEDTVYYKDDIKN